MILSARAEPDATKDRIMAGQNHRHLEPPKNAADGDWIEESERSGFLQRKAIELLRDWAAIG